jgi:thiamine biosynthesis protein ThiS
MSSAFEHSPVELNRRIVPRSRYAATSLADRDELEIVTLVGGG